MKARFLPVMLVALAVAATQSLVAADQKETCQCPVSGKPIDKAHSVEFMDMQVYFCCPNCPKAFQANTAKYENQAKSQFLCTSQIKQVACPLSGRPMKENITAIVDGQTIHFCCKNCQKKVQEAGDQEKLVLVFGDLDKGFAKAEK